MGLSSGIKGLNEEFLQLDTKADDCWWGPIRDHDFIDSYKTDYEFVHPLKFSKIRNHIEFYQNKNDSALSVGNVGDSCVYCNLYLFGFQRYSSIKMNQ